MMVSVLQKMTPKDGVAVVVLSEDDDFSDVFEMFTMMLALRQ